MKTIISILLFLPIALTAQTQNLADANIPYIEVIGSAEKEIVPNIISIRIVLQEVTDKVKIPIEEQEAKLKDKLKENGFSLNSIVIRNANASQLQLSKKSYDVRNRKEYLMKVTTVGEAYKVFKILDEINVRDANIFETSHTEIQAFRKEVKQLALKAAKEKASELLKSIDEQVDKPLIIRELTENEFVQNRDQYSNIAIGSYKEEVKYETDILEIKPLKLKHSMFARFRIKQ